MFFWRWYLTKIFVSFQGFMRGLTFKKKVHNVHVNGAQFVRQSVQHGQNECAEYTTHCVLFFKIQSSHKIFKREK
jgi:hypothetical protein